MIIAYPPEPVQSSSKKRKPAIFLAAAVLMAVVLLAGGFKFGQYWLSADRLVSRFEHALLQKDGQAIVGLMTTDDERLDLQKADVQGFLAYLEEHPEAAGELTGSLRKQSFLLAGGESISPDSESAIHLVKSKKLLVLDSYRLSVSPVFIELSTNYKGASFLVGGKEVAKSQNPGDPYVDGPLLPGIYAVEARLKTDYVDLSSVQEAELWGGVREYSATLDLQGDEVEIRTGLEGDGLQGRLYLNDKDVGVNPFENRSYGPVTTDGSLNLAVEADFPWGAVRSNELPIMDSYMEVNVADSEPLQAALIEKANQFQQEWLEGMATGDAAKLKSGTEAMRGELSRSIEEAGLQGRLMTASFTGAAFDLDSFRLESAGGQWHGMLDTAVHRLRADYRADDLPPQELREEVELQGMTLIYDESAAVWMVDSVRGLYGSELTNERVKYVENSHPQTFKSSPSALLNPSADSGKSEIGAFLLRYLEASVEAINARDFQVVAAMHDPDGPSYKESENYILHLEEKGITEQLLSAEVDGIELQEDGSYNLSTSESYAIAYKDGTEKTKAFKSSYKVVLIDGKPRVRKLLEVKEQ
ncbi:zinc ribbon domain-containing protein [Paenibacillus sp. A51L]